MRVAISVKNTGQCEYFLSMMSKHRFVFRNCGSTGVFMVDVDTSAELKRAKPEDYEYVESTILAEFSVNFCTCSIFWGSSGSEIMTPDDSSVNMLTRTSEYALQCERIRSYTAKCFAQLEMICNLYNNTWESRAVERGVTDNPQDVCNWYLYAGLLAKSPELIVESLSIIKGPIVLMSCSSLGMYKTKSSDGLYPQYVFVSAISQQNLGFFYSGQAFISPLWFRNDISAIMCFRKFINMWLSVLGVLSNTIDKNRWTSDMEDLKENQKNIGDETKECKMMNRWHKKGKTNRKCK